MRIVFNNDLALGRWARRARTAVVAGILGMSAAACSTTAANDAGAAPVFIAYASDFSGFHSWTSMPGVAPGAPQPGDGGVHSGPLTTYINHLPPSGSTSFPIGTIIVKEPNDPPLTTRQIFAMVKRGGGFNSDGADNWEWFELRNIDMTNVEIIWGGAEPLTGESYASNPNLCNDCHTMNAKNDFVWTQGLQLSSL
jgi:hypothetical protein